MNTGVITAPVLARTVPFLIYVAFLPLTDGLSRIVPGGDVRWLYGLQVALVSVSLFVYRRHYTELWEVKAPGSSCQILNQELVQKMELMPEMK